MTYTNDTVTVTNQEVDIATAEGDEGDGDEGDGEGGEKQGGAFLE
ncbi:MAG TPA: hypothetical protein VKA95_12510 [Nitrososphaeraceae archaeon]|nr:hypothetical protein [Nitrososphaeraceae archaeon]